MDINANMLATGWNSPTTLGLLGWRWPDLRELSDCFCRSPRLVGLEQELVTPSRAAVRAHPLPL
eukprot:COSAG01_NODE_55571_length_317_cov_0.688889_1_plen_63_part_10